MSIHKKSQQQKEIIQNESNLSQIKVYIRARPIRSQFSKKCLKIIDHGVALHFKDKIHQLYFDNIFDQNSSQQKVFQQSCLPIVQDVLNGNNASLFVYGQTGTGKTFTMGTLETIKSQDQGLIPLTLNYLMNSLQQQKQDNEWSISLSFMQIYMQDIYDLLNPGNGKLQIREDLEYGQTYVQDLVIVPINNYKQSIQLINAGLKYRKIGNQKMNQLSSRSHTIFTIYISQKISNTEYISSTLSLIDLAGSQRIKKSNSTQLRLDQAKFINTSLSSLGNVIAGLSENNIDKFIPYRSSKLTRILKNSLTGFCKITVICTVEITEQNLYQTYSTLLFADRCKAIRFPNQPIISIETFEQLQQEKDLKQALQHSYQKQKQYLDIIRNLQQNGHYYSNNNNNHNNSSISINKQTQRQSDLSQIIQSVYKLFQEINIHLKKINQPNKRYTIEKEILPKITHNSSIASIKLNITTMAQQTINSINSFSSMIFGQNLSSSSSSMINSYSNRIQCQTLSSMLLDSMRQNLKLYETVLMKDDKDSLERQIALEQYQKQRKIEIINKLKLKKLKNLQNNFEQIWAQSDGQSNNPLQNLLNRIRRTDSTSLIQQHINKQFDQNSKEQQLTNNPKQLLKILTRKQSQRHNKEILINDNQDIINRNNNQIKIQQQQEQEQQQMQSSSISYFKKKNISSPIKTINEQCLQEPKKILSSNKEIKKLLDSLIANRNQFQQKQKNKLKS